METDPIGSAVFHLKPDKIVSRYSEQKLELLADFFTRSVTMWEEVIPMAVEKILMFTIAVMDMAKAKAFYAEKLGFQVTRDYGQGDQHWVSLDAPGVGRL